jgi:hypothetical protein
MARHVGNTKHVSGLNSEVLDTLRQLSQQETAARKPSSHGSAAHSSDLLTAPAARASGAGEASTAAAPQKTGWAPVDRSQKTWYVVYAAPADPKRGYSDKEKYDFATQVRAALQPELDEFNSKYGYYPAMKPLAVDIYAAYQDAMPQLESEIKASGLLDQAPQKIRNGELDYVQKRHLRENTTHKERDRALLKPLSAAGQAALAKETWVDEVKRPFINHSLKKEEKGLVQARQLREYTYQQLFKRAMAVSEHLTPVFDQVADANSIVTGQYVDVLSHFDLDFKTHAELEVFFKETFGTALEPLRPENEAAALKGILLSNLNLIRTTHSAEFKKLSISLKNIDFKSPKDVHQWMRGLSAPISALLPPLELSDVQSIHLRAEQGFKKHSVNQDLNILDLAFHHRKTAFAIGEDHLRTERPNRFVLPDRSVVQNVGTEQAPEYQLASGDGACVLSFKTVESENGESKIELMLHNADLANPVTPTDANFNEILQASFGDQLLHTLFDGHTSADLQKAGSFERLYGHYKANFELKTQLAKAMRVGVKEAIKKRVEAALPKDGRAVMMIGTGDSYNPGLYGVNFGVEDNVVALEATQDLAEENYWYDLGSCGKHQKAARRAGGPIAAYQDGGKTYRYSDHGGDPLEGEGKQIYLRVPRNTMLAGKYEDWVNKRKAMRDVDGELKEVVVGGDWAARDKATVKVDVMRTSEGVEVQSLMLRDAEGQVFVGSDQMRPTSYTGHDGQTHAVPEGGLDLTQVRSLELVDTLPGGEILLDDQGTPVVDEHGHAVTTPEKLVLTAMLDGQAVSDELLIKKRLAIGEELEASDFKAAWLNVVINPRVAKRRAELQLKGEISLEELKEALHQFKAELLGAALQPSPSEVEDMGRFAIEQKEQELRSQISLQVTHIERWETVPIIETAEGGSPKPAEDTDGNILNTYRKVSTPAGKQPMAKDLVDWVTVKAHCVHSQNSLVQPESEDVMQPDEPFGVSMPSGGVEADPLLISSFRPVITQHWSRPFGLANAPGSTVEGSTMEMAAWGSRRGPSNTDTGQLHIDMHRYEARGTSKGDDAPALGNCPLVGCEIEDVHPDNHSNREGIQESVMSAIRIADKRDVDAESKDKLKSAREELKGIRIDQDGKESNIQGGRLFIDGLQSPKETQIQLTGSDLHQEIVVDHALTQKLYAAVSWVDRNEQAQKLKPISAPSTKTDFKPQLEKPKAALRKTGAADTPLPEIKPKEPFKQTPVQLQETLDERLELFEKTVKALDDAFEKLKRIEQQPGGEVGKIDARNAQLAKGKQRHFTRTRDRAAMTAETKAYGAPMGDFFEVFRLIAELTHAAPAVGDGLGAGVLIGSLVLGAAGVGGAVDAGADIQRLSKFIAPLKAYRNEVAELEKTLKRDLTALEKNGATPTEQAKALEETTRATLEGIEVRLAAAHRQLRDAVVNVATSGVLAAAGGAGVVTVVTSVVASILGTHVAAATHASLMLGAHVGGAVYGGLVATFGAATALQGMVRLSQLSGTSERVDAELGKDNSLRYGLQNLIGHEKAARRHEIATRLFLTGAGLGTVAAHVGAAFIDGMGGSGAVSTGVAIASGTVMGGATKAAFKAPVSRQRGLHAVGVSAEETTNLSTSFLSNPAQLNHLVNKISNQIGMLTHHQRDMLKHDLPDFDFGKHRKLAKLLPSHDKRELRRQMAANPQAVADNKMQFMSHTTQLERWYLEAHKVPLLQKDVEVLTHELFKLNTKKAPNKVEQAKMEHLTLLLQKKFELMSRETTRLEQLQNLEAKLAQFSKYLDRKTSLSVPKVAAEFKEMEIDFMIAHGMVHESLSVRDGIKLANKLNALEKEQAQQGQEPQPAQEPSRLKKLLRKKPGENPGGANAQSPGAEEVPSTPSTSSSQFTQRREAILREALGQTTERRFHMDETTEMRSARVFTEGYGNKMAYERRGALEIGREMFSKKNVARRAAQKAQAEAQMAAQTEAASAATAPQEPPAPPPAPGLAAGPMPDVAAQPPAARKSGPLDFVRTISGNLKSRRSGRVYVPADRQATQPKLWSPFSRGSSAAQSGSSSDRADQRSRRRDVVATTALEVSGAVSNVALRAAGALLD